MNPRHPVYIVSKGRAANPMTSRALDRMGVAHYVVVEAEQRDAYEATRPELATLLELDPAYQRAYDPCDELGMTRSLGPGPARNFAWEHAIAAGASSHWVMDDNHWAFHRFNRNHKIPLGDGTGFAVMETFVDRYENVAMAGPAYHGLVVARAVHAPFTPNTRIYSCNLIRNDVPFRWRGRYNEDTDLSIRMLKAGWVTVQFNAFLQGKRTTQTVRGGNTEEFYRHEGTLPKSEMLVRMHPDVARLVWRYGRPHHVVDYSRFRGNRLVRRPDVVVPEGVDEHGMEFQERIAGEWRPTTLPLSRHGGT